MIKQKRLITAPYPSDLLFHIAQDVENYCHFLPHCVAARILDKSQPEWQVENLYRWGPIRYKFITYAQVSPNKRIHIQSAPSQKVQLEILWDFTPCGDAETNVLFEMAFSTQIPFLERIVNARFDEMMIETERAFLKRAQSLIDH